MEFLPDFTALFEQLPQEHRIWAFGILAALAGLWVWVGPDRIARAIRSGGRATAAGVRQPLADRDPEDLAKLFADRTPRE